MNPDDSGHRPHGEHFGEEPDYKIKYGPEGIEVSLEHWSGEADDNLLSTLYSMAQANWGDSPCREDARPHPSAMKFVEDMFAGRKLQNPLEIVSFSFCVNNISRACTHQLVRSRVGAMFMQHGGRDNDWRHRDFRCPETVRRIVRDIDNAEEPQPDDQKEYGLDSFLQNPDPLRHVMRVNQADSTSLLLYDYIKFGKVLYAALVDSGVPWQDARRFLPIGTTTYLHANYNYLALKGFLSNRLEFNNDWEINCVAQLMLREIKMKCPEMVSKPLMSHSDRQQRAAFAGHDSWPPDQKWPSPYDPRTKKHDNLQMPFWVLSEDSMDGGVVEWIPTNGVHPNADTDGKEYIGRGQNPASQRGN